MSSVGVHALTPSSSASTSIASVLLWGGPESLQLCMLFDNAADIV